MTLSNDQVNAYLRDRFELVRLERNDGDAVQDAAIEGLGVGDFPSVLVLDGKGVERLRLAGFEPPEEFLAALKRIEAELGRGSAAPAREATTSGG